MTNGLVMAGYIDDMNEEELGLTAPEQSEDMDIPLLDTNTIDNPKFNTLCLYHQPGFTHQSDEGAKDARLKIMLATSLCVVFMIMEFLGGYLAGSLAIMTDAAHLMSDCISFIIGLLAIWISTKPADRKMSFGYKRIEVLGAIVSILGIWFLTVLLIYLAIYRIVTNDFSIDADTMMIVAGIGIVINIIMGFILHGSFSFHSHGHSHSSHSHSNSKHVENKSNNYTSHMPMQHEQDNHIPTFVVVNHATNNAIRPRQGSINKDMQNKQSSTNIPYTSLNHNHHHGRSDANTNGLYITDTILPNVHANSHSHSHGDGEVHNSSVSGSSSSSENLNIRAALIHVLGDFIQSIGVFLAAVVIKFYPNCKIADPLCTLLFSVIVMLTTIKIIKESIFVVLDAVPKSICLAKLEADLKSIEGVRSVHHLNVWSQTVNQILMMGHITIDEFTDSNIVLKNALNLARAKYNIKHSTFQIERYHSHDN